MRFSELQEARFENLTIVGKSQPSMLTEKEMLEQRSSGISMSNPQNVAVLVWLI